MYIKLRNIIKLTLVLLLDFLTSLTSNCSIFKLTRTAEAAARATRVLDDDVKKSMNSGTLTVEPSKKRSARIYMYIVHT